MKVPSSGDVRSALGRPNNIKLASSLIRKQPMIAEARNRVKAMQSLTESVRLSMPLDMARQSLAENQELCSGSRTIGIEIMLQLAGAYEMQDNILASAIALLDRFLAAQCQDCENEAGADTHSSIQDGGNIKHIAVACFMLANKFVGSSSLWIDDILGVVRLKCSSAEIESTEGMVLSSIDWSLHLATGEARLHCLCPVPHGR